MKHTYSRNSWAKRSDTSGLWITTLIVIMIISFDRFSGGIVRTSVRSIATGFAEAGMMLTTAVTNSGIFRANASLAKELAALKETVDVAEAHSVAYEVIKAENDRLRGMLGLASSTQGTIATVVTSTQKIPYGTFLASVPHSFQASSSALVYSKGEIVIGRVIESTDDAVLIRELFAPGSTVAALVNESTFSLEGRGSGNARGRLPRAAKISIGDIVTSPDVKGGAIGKVGAILPDEGGSYQDIYVEQSVNFSTLHTVYIAEK